MKFKLVENLTESSLSRLHNINQSCAIGFITAFKSPRWIKDHYGVEDGANTPRDVLKVNQERNDNLEKNLKALGYNYFKAVGSYENQERKKAGKKNYTDKEQSFGVVDTYHDEEFISNMLKLAKDYDQESVLIVPAGGSGAKLYYTNGKVEELGSMKLGVDAPFKSLISGRPMVIEDLEFIDWIKVKTMGQYNRYKEVNK